MKPEDEMKFKELQAAVLAANKAKTEWLDSKMSEYAEFKPGDEIWNANDGKRLGIVCEVKRHYRGSFEFDSLSIFYTYQDGFIDNTSRISAIPISKGKLAELLRGQASLLCQR
jgi:hypothetical protein